MFSLEENNFIFCLNTDKILPFVSVGAFIVDAAFINAGLDGSFELKY